MGHTKTFKYRLEFTDGTGRHIHSWSGHATERLLKSWIEAYEASLQIGGANEHISMRLGFVPFVNSAKIVNQETGQSVVTWQAPMFRVV